MTRCGEIVALRKEIYKPSKFLLVFVVHTQSIHQNLQKNILFKDMPLYEVANLSLRKGFKEIVKKMQNFDSPK